MSLTFQQNLDEHRDLFTRLDALAAPVEQAARLIAGTLSAGGKLMLCGNGGSAADSQHLAAEFTGRFIKDRRPLAALALSTDSSALTCIANDYSFDEVFYRQVLGLGLRGDCLLAISTSGNSRNVVRAVEAARERGVRTIGLLGRDGGALAGLCELAIVVPSSTTARIQEAHILIGHSLCGMVEAALQLA
jgi:D-sedoheptulose 7-phosphate isomerase